MAELLIQDVTLTAIANAIREKTGNIEQLYLSQMPDCIREISGSLPDSETVAFGSDAEFEEEYEITSDRLNEIATEAKRFARTSEALSPAQIVQSLQEAMDDNLFIEGRVPEVHSETVTKIRQYCFYGDETLAKFEAPNVTSIGVNSFDGCSNLTDISIPKITSVPNYAFRNCSSLSNFDMNLITSIGEYGFYNSGIKSVSAPLVTKINMYTFNNCINLETVELPSCTSLSNYAFQNTGIKNIDLPLVKTIGTGCFSNCANLKTVHFSEATSCGESSFDNCTALTRCEFDVTVSFDKYRVFRNCTSLEALILRGDAVSVFDSWTYQDFHSFYNSGITLGTCYIYVPRALVDTYKSDSKWSTYANQIRAIEDYPDVCDGKEVIREYVFDTSKEADYTFDKNHVNSDDGYSLITEYNCELVEEEIDSGKMVSVSVDINLTDFANIESLEVE